MTRIRSAIPKASITILLRADQSQLLDQNGWIHQSSMCVRKSQLRIIRSDVIRYLDNVQLEKPSSSRKCIVSTLDMNSQRTRAGILHPLECLSVWISRSQTIQPTNTTHSNGQSVNIITAPQHIGYAHDQQRHHVSIRQEKKFWQTPLKSSSTPDINLYDRIAEMNSLRPNALNLGAISICCCLSMASKNPAD